MNLCPSIEDLRQFIVGDVDGAAFERITAHLKDCPRCQQVLAKHDSYEDGLLSDLRELSEIKSPDVPKSVIKAAVSAVSEKHSGDRTPSNIHFDAGQAYAGRLKEGPVRLGRFELQSELGVGSFGYVFLARDRDLERDVAVKISRTGGHSGDKEIDAFMREARAVAQLSHPNIVSIHDSGQTEDGVCFLVSEFIHGETLETRLRRGAYVPVEATKLAMELADALDYAHDNDVIHRDVKPSNIILDQDGHPHLTDFGLAKRSTVRSNPTTDGQIMGTPAYMSPEQARGDSSKVDIRSDVYGLGVVLYELLTGERPFQGGRRLALLQVLEEEPRPLRALKEDIPGDLETICLKAMAKTPQRRYPNAAAFRADLRRYLNGEAISARPISQRERLIRWGRKYPLAASLMAAVVVGSAVGFTVLTHLSTWFVQETALDGVRREADLFEGVNDYYSEDVLDTARLQAYWDKGVGEANVPQAIKITHQYATMKNSLPYPKTFTIDAGKRISASVPGMHVRLYSDRPWRDDGGPQNEFEQTALERFRNPRTNQSSPLEYHEFSHEGDLPIVQYARAQVMKENCVNCHNTHQSSPRNDWKVGDVVGVLTITRPLERDIERTRSGLRGAFAWVAASAISLLVLLLALLPRRQILR